MRNHSPTLGDMCPRLLFDDVVPIKRPNPVKAEIDRLNANQSRLLAYLEARRGQWVSTWDLITLAQSGARAAARAWELQQKGYAITRRHVAGGRWEWKLS